MTFGVGTHFCMGSALARLVLHTALRRMLERFPDIELVDPDFRPKYAGQLGELQAGVDPDARPLTSESALPIPQAGAIRA